MIDVLMVTHLCDWAEFLLPLIPIWNYKKSIASR